MVRFDCFAISERGAVAEDNDDFAIIEPGSGVFIIADGMGGRPGGAQASRAAARSFHEHIRSLGPASRGETRQLAGAVAFANAEVRALGEADVMLKGLGTTLSAVLLQGPRGKVVHVGDSRVYLFHDHELHQLTEDHTLVAALVERQHISADGAKRHPLRSVLSRCIGGQETVEPDIVDLKVQADDWLILATDGLDDAVDSQRLRALIEAGRSDSAEDLCRGICSLALANGPRDNVTVIVVHVVSCAGTPHGGVTDE